MKKSFMSISLLVVSISMLVLFVCSSSAHAANSSRFIYNKGENVETVYTIDKTGKLLTPKLKYEFSKGADTQSKVAFAWNSDTESWNPYYKLTMRQSGTDTVLEYAAWEGKTNGFTGNLQKVVYNKGLQDELLSYISYNWNPKEESWVLNQHLLLEEYLAMEVPGMN